MGGGTSLAPVFVRQIAGLNEFHKLKTACRDGGTDALPYSLGHIFARDGRSGQHRAQILSFKRLQYTIFDQAIQRDDIGHHPGLRVNRTMHRYKEIPGMAAMTVVYRRK